MYKICHMTSVHKSDDVRIFRKECVSLAKRDDLDVYLVAPGESREEAGVHVIGAAVPGRGRLGRMTKTSREIYEAARKLDADLYHFHDPELLPYGKKLAAAGKKVIFDSHENTVRQISIKPYIPARLRPLAAKTYRDYETRCIRGLAAVIYPCPEEGVHPFAGRAKRTCYINNVPMKEEFYDCYDEERRNAALDAGSYVCHVGSLTHERGITTLIEGCYRAGVKLVLGGNFSPAGYEESLRAKESFAAVDHRGFCDRQQVFAIYQGAAIGASTILNVGQYAILGNLPTKVYEFMAMGIPVILTDMPYARAINEECDFALLVDPEDAGAIQEAIRKLLGDPELARRLGDNGRRTIRERFSWEREEETLYRLYDEILNEH
ncbi:MAG: glycosyltransferase [Firmicutes bacterium]|nr:glycosyltransferase [Bacillota bacterium]